jgi:hypothetical protein
MTTPLYPPPAEFVAVTWLKRLTALYTDLVTDADTKLPDQSTWTKPVYLQATLVTGVQDIYSPERVQYVMVDSWAGEKDYNVAATVAELLVDATLDGSGLGEFAVKNGFFPVRLAEVSVYASPRRVPDDPAKLARSSTVLAFIYVINK